MGGKLSASESPLGEQQQRGAGDGPALSGSVNGLNHRHHHRHHHHHHYHHRLSHQTPPAAGAVSSVENNGAGRSRTRSHGGFTHHRNHASPSDEAPGGDRLPLGDSNDSSVLERPRSRSLVTAGSPGSVPLRLFSFHGIKCPVCAKVVPPSDIECHLVMCFTKPRVIYNEDVLKEDKGECVICLDDLVQGDTIARLPCLCIYHKSCIDRWFRINRSCPEHPGD